MVTDFFLTSETLAGVLSNSSKYLMFLCSDRLERNKHPSCRKRLLQEPTDIVKGMAEIYTVACQASYLRDMYHLLHLTAPYF
jgi:hypothetical protein